MAIGWTKRYMPRSLFGRAALILIVPAVVLQIVLSVVFISRHYEGVTDKLSWNLSRELRILLEEVDRAATLAEAQAAVAELARAFELKVVLPDAPPERNSVRFYDFSGRQIIRSMLAYMPTFQAADLVSDPQGVRVWFGTRHGPLRVEFGLTRVKAFAPHHILVLMVVTGAVMTLLAYLFLRNQLRPIARLAQAATEFGRGRIVPYRSAGAAEVRAAGNAFLDMRARIDRQIEQRTMMLSGVSHDLRTPLTRLKLGLELLDDPETEPLRRDVADMERLLKEFLAFAREETLDDPEEVDPRALVAEVVDRFREAGGEVTLAEASGGGPAMLRPMAVSRALENLLGNALRYGSRAEVRLAATDRAVRISVEDDGPGIPEAERAEAVKPFVRLDAARNQNRGPGVGLGLAIAQDIARRHGGALVLGESDTLGGLKVDLVLPR